MRKWLASAAVFGLIVATPLVISAQQQASGVLDGQVLQSRSTRISTSSTSWADVPGLDDLLICAQNEVSASLSVGLDGGPVGVRIEMDDTTILEPGPVRFDPAGNPSFSYTFAVPSVSNGPHTFDLQWRSPNGRNVHLNRGSLNLLYQFGNC